jgi:hypothetical protein
VTANIVSAGAIQQEYDRLGYSLGWRFLTCPESHATDPKALIISLNPAGREEHGPPWSQEAGSAYVVESWKGLPAGNAPLQIQVQRLVERLGLDIGQVLSGHFVPFRSPSWDELAHREEAISFGKKLWYQFASGLKPRRVICIGHEVSTHLRGLFGVHKLRDRPSGWGPQKIRTATGRNGLQLVSLPHLSRFTLFTSEACQPYLDSVFAETEAIDA